jgi:hypothetical protein
LSCPYLKHERAGFFDAVVDAFADAGVTLNLT